MCKSTMKRGDEGMAMLVGLVFVAVAMMITGVISTQLIGQGRQVEVFEDVNLAYQALDNANTLAKVDVLKGGTGIIGIDQDWEPVYNGEVLVMPEFSDSVVDAVEMDDLPGIKFIAYTITWGDDGRDNNGDGTVDEPEEDNIFTVYAKVELNGESFQSAMRVDSGSPLMVGEMQMAAAAFDLGALANEVQFVQVADAGLSTYAAIPVLLQGQDTGYSSGASGTKIVKQTEVILFRQRISVWDNAIFGEGQEGHAINGNVSIHGGVHVLGETVIPGDDVIIAEDTVDLGGTSYVRNNYDVGAGQTPEDRIWESIPPLKQVMVNGELVDTLEAKFRVRNGNVNLDGNASLGQEDEGGNEWKEYLDAVYVNGTFNDSTQIYADGGIQGYDLGNAVALPKLDDDYINPTTGETEARDDGSIYSHQEFFTENLANGRVLEGNLNLTVGNSNAAPFTGVAPTSSSGIESLVDSNFEMASEINSLQFGNIQDAAFGSVTGVVAPAATALLAQGGNTPRNFYYNATQNVMINGGDISAINPALLVANGATGDDFILFNAAEGRLYANGQIVIEGNLNLTGPQNSELEFTGRAAIMVVDGEDRDAAPNTAKGNINLSVTMLSLNADGTHELSYPVSNVIGFMADGDLSLGGTAQMTQMGAFFAEESIAIDRQTHTMGTIVAGQFDMGGQVPNIYQVPALSTNLPHGMVGEWPHWQMEEQSWREMTGSTGSGTTETTETTNPIGTI